MLIWLNYDKSTFKRRWFIFDFNSIKQRPDLLELLDLLDLLELLDLLDLLLKVGGDCS